MKGVHTIVIVSNGTIERHSVSEQKVAEVKRLISSTAAPVECDYLKEVLIEVSGINFLRTSRVRRMKDVRHVYFYLASFYTNSTLKDIGMLEKQYDHTSVIYGRERVKELLSIHDEDVTSLVENTIAQLCLKP